MPSLQKVLGPLVTNRRTLHVGCVGSRGPNPGENFSMHRYLATLTGQLLGVDLDAEGVSQMREAGFDAVVADAETFASPESYEAVLVLSVLQFCAAPLKVLQNLARCLNPGGVMVVSVPNVLSPYELYRETFQFGRPRRIPPTGQSSYGLISLFNTSSLALLVVASGLDVERVYRSRSKAAWSRRSVREGLYNLLQYAPGVLLPVFSPTLVSVGRKPR